MYTIEFKNVEYSYNSEKVLKGISFYAKKGEALGIIGNNGAGKSTILSLCATLFNPL